MHRLFGDSPMPRYAQLAELFRQRIARGTWEAGQRLPSLDELTEEFDVARVTVQIRVGLNSGEVVVRSIGSDLRMDYSAVGQTTHLAARMEQLAMPGTIRLTGATQDRKSTRLNSSHMSESRMPSSA